MTDAAPPPRPRRSALYVPGSNTKALAKLHDLASDVVIIDLEDAVAPEMKAEARAAAVSAAAHKRPGNSELVIRVNSLDTLWGAEDLAALRNCPVDAILVPKVSSSADVARHAKAAGGTPLWAMIETSRAMLRLEDIASAPGLAALLMGTNDLAKEMTARPDAARTEFAGLLALSVAAARAHGLSIFDAVYNRLDDESGFAAECAQGRRFGFDGKSLIHPKQIAPCHAAFSPSADELATAERIIAAFALPENADKGAIRLEGQMVERLHMQSAQQLLASARAMGLR